MDYQQRYEGALSFETAEDLRAGLKAAQDFLDARETPIALEKYVVTEAVYTTTGLVDETFFRIEQNRLAPASAFNDMTVALGYLAVYAASGAIECLIDFERRVERRFIGGKSSEK